MYVNRSLDHTLVFDKCKMKTVLGNGTNKRRHNSGHIITKVQASFSLRYEVNKLDFKSLNDRCTKVQTESSIVNLSQREIFEYSSAAVNQQTSFGDHFGNPYIYAPVNTRLSESDQAVCQSIDSNSQEVHIDDRQIDHHKQDSVNNNEQSDSAVLTNFEMFHNLLSELISLYAFSYEGDKSVSDNDFTVFGVGGRRLTIADTVQLENRSIRINKLLNGLRTGRLEADLREKFTIFHKLKDIRYRHMIQFERLLEEIVWVTLHCVDDVQTIGLMINKQQKIELLALAEQLLVICIQHTIKSDQYVKQEQSARGRVDAIKQWLADNPLGFDERAMQIVRHNLRCRLASSLGHIYSFKSELKGNSKKQNRDAKEAATYFRAKTDIDPSCVEQNIRRDESRKIYYRTLDLHR